MSDLSPTTKALLRAARDEAPSHAARAKIWTSVGGTGAAGGAAVGAAAAKAAAATGSAKLLILGALLGSTVTVGLATIALRMTHPSLRPDPMYAIQPERDPPPVAPASRGVLELTPQDHASGDSLSGDPAPADSAPGTDHATKDPAAARKAHANRQRRGDTLAQEAALLAEARGALMRGEPESALAALRAARSLPVRALEPESLALEARALRAEGHFSEADAAEARLRQRYPDNGLIR
jgi:hypothetical protein